MAKDDEKMLRTKNKNMVICSVKTVADGNVDLIVRNGKKEDSISINEFLTLIYGRPVAVMIV